MLSSIHPYTSLDYCTTATKCYSISVIECTAPNKRNELFGCTWVIVSTWKGGNTIFVGACYSHLSHDVILLNRQQKTIQLLWLIECLQTKRMNNVDHARVLRSIWKIQRRAVRYVCGIYEQKAPITDTQTTLGWDTLEQWRLNSSLWAVRL